MNNPEQPGRGAADAYEAIEPAILASTREAIAKSGVQALRVDLLSERDLGNMPWSGSSVHLVSVRKQLERAKAGEVEYLAVRSPEGYPVSVGCVDYTQEPDGGFLFQVGTHEQLRGFGIGTHLIQEVERRIAARGREWARLEVETDNPRAKELYERLGYEVYGDLVTDSWEELDKEGNIMMHHAECFQMRKRVKSE